MEEAPEVSAVATATAALAHHESLSSEQRMEAEKVVLLAFRYFDKTCELAAVAASERLRAAVRVPTARVCEKLLMSLLDCSYTDFLAFWPPHRRCDDAWDLGRPCRACWAPPPPACLLRTLQAAGSLLGQTASGVLPPDMAT